MRKGALMLTMLMLLASAAMAEDRPLLHLSRLSVAAGVDYAEVHIPGYGAVVNFEVGPFVAYQILATEPRLATDGTTIPSRPILALAGSAVYGTETESMRYRIGLRLLVFAGGY